MADDHPQVDSDRTLVGPVLTQVQLVGEAGMGLLLLAHPQNMDSLRVLGLYLAWLEFQPVFHAQTA